MSRLVLLRVPHDAVGELGIDWHDEDHHMYTMFVPIPEDDQFMRDLDSVTRVLLWPDAYRWDEDAAHRLRVAAGLDEE